MCRKFSYGPQAASEDMERIEFKMKFLKILQVIDFVFPPLSLVIMHELT
jgi:hypothetical protein